MDADQEDFHLPDDEAFYHLSEETDDLFVHLEDMFPPGQRCGCMLGGWEWGWGYCGSVSGCSTCLFGRGWSLV